MTEKQEQLLQAALELFATEGYHATSTSKVARKAKVSEGLIFKHFINKEGLLAAVLDMGKQRSQDLFSIIFNLNDPKERIEKVILLPFDIPTVDYEFWRLQFKLKWELNINDPEKIRPLADSLSEAFKHLHAKKPELEAELILHQLEGISSALLKGLISNKKAISELLIEKFRTSYP